MIFSLSFLFYNLLEIKDISTVLTFLSTSPNLSLELWFLYNDV